LALKNPDLKVIDIDVSNEEKRWREMLARKLGMQNHYCPVKMPVCSAMN
jgi:hypothetical protein